MTHIAIISSTGRRERRDHSVAKYYKYFLHENNIATAEILDLREYNFPILENSKQTLQNTDKKVLDFSEKIKSADGIIIVTPEFNGGFPETLQNVINLLCCEWIGKPIGISTVSVGTYGGSKALYSMQFLLWKIGAWTVTNMFPIRNVDSTFDYKGRPVDKAGTDKLTQVFIDRLVDSIYEKK